MAGQYEDAFRPPRMQCWTVPRPPPKLPRPDPPTQFIADDRGHLLPGIPRSQVSPWGTFLGTWEMPPRIPPPRLDLTSRSAGPASRIIQSQPPILSRVCNGIRIHVTGKFQEPRQAQPPREPSGKTQGTDPSQNPSQNPPPSPPSS
ncbi:protein Flattop [Chiroxiphia lanceolata]|uniref:protein Flattop n=1 Tax=Chiroxiphia lanceolata TaxID=296741 RepID=UPI0013CE814F|nr:protein Flattop [Chiroxiphia lanceolata]